MLNIVMHIVLKTIGKMLFDGSFGFYQFCLEKKSLQAIILSV